MSRGKAGWNCWSSPYIFGSRDYAGWIMKKMIINAIKQIRQKTTNATQDQIEFKRWK